MTALQLEKPRPKGKLNPHLSAPPETPKALEGKPLRTNLHVSLGAFKNSPLRTLFLSFPLCSDQDFQDAVECAIWASLLGFYKDIKKNPVRSDLSYLLILMLGVALTCFLQCSPRIQARENKSSHANSSGKYLDRELSALWLRVLFKQCTLFQVVPSTALKSISLALPFVSLTDTLCVLPT